MWTVRACGTWTPICWSSSSAPSPLAVRRTEKDERTRLKHLAGFRFLQINLYFFKCILFDKNIRPEKVFLYQWFLSLALNYFYEAKAFLILFITYDYLKESWFLNIYTKVTTVWFGQHCGVMLVQHPTDFSLLPLLGRSLSVDNQLSDPSKCTV